MDEKIVPFEEVSSKVAAIRAAKPGGAIVLCHGCFDIVHPGHIRHLRFAREQGVALVVSITPDCCIQKGSNRPLMPQALRAENLAALEIVDLVTVAPGETGIEPIAAIKPDLYVKGSEYAVSQDPRFLKEKDLVEELGGTVVFSSGDVVFSSSGIIRDHDMDMALTEKFNYICRRHKIDKDMILKKLESAKELTTLVVGEALLDETLQCEGLGMSQDAPVLSLSLKHKSLSLGGAAAMSLHLAAAGMKIRFLSSVRPEGQAYEAFSLALQEAGVELLNVEDRFRQVCVKSHYMVNRNKALELENASYRQLDSSARTALMRRYRKALKEGLSLALLSDYGYGLLSDDLATSMVAEAGASETLADINMTPRTNLAKFGDAKSLALTEAELRACMHDYQNGLSVIVDRHYKESSVKQIFLMLNDGGSLFFKKAPPLAGHNNMESVHVPPLVQRAEGRTGLAEAFTAGIAFGRASKMSPEQSCYLAALFVAAFMSAPASAKSIEKERLLRLVEERKELAP